MVKAPVKARDLYHKYVETVALLNRLEKEKVDLKNAILAHLGDQRSAVEHGFAVKLTPGTRKTLVASLVSSALGVKIPDSCYKTTPYDSLSVVQLKHEA